MASKQSPKISIVTPSFNQGDYLSETIDSVLSQAYDNFEYIIVDGGSTDQSLEIIRKYEKHLKYWVSEPDAGQTQAINKGFTRSSGEICAYLNSDDKYAPGILRTVADDYLRSIDRAQFWKAYVVEVFNEGGVVDTIYPNPDCRLSTWLSTAFGLLQPGVFWSRSIYDRVDGFDERFQYVFDRHFFMNALSLGYTYDTSQDTVAASYRRHENAKTVKDQVVFQKEYDLSDQVFINSFPTRRRIPLIYRVNRSRAWGLLDDSNRSGIGRSLRFRNLTTAAFTYPPVVCSSLFWKIVVALPFAEFRE